MRQVSCLSHCICWLTPVLFVLHLTCHSKKVFRLDCKAWSKRQKIASPFYLLIYLFIFTFPLFLIFRTKNFFSRSRDAARNRCSKSQIGASHRPLSVTKWCSALYWRRVRGDTFSQSLIRISLAHIASEQRRHGHQPTSLDTCFMSWEIFTVRSTEYILCITIPMYGVQYVLSGKLLSYNPTSAWNKETLFPRCG